MSFAEFIGNVVIWSFWGAVGGLLFLVGVGVIIVLWEKAAWKFKYQPAAHLLGVEEMRGSKIKVVLLIPIGRRRGLLWAREFPSEPAPYRGSPRVIDEEDEDE